MRLIVLSISIWALCFVTAEEDDTKCHAPAQFRCVPPPGQSFSCNNNEICGCRLNVTYDETAKQWRKGGEPVQIKFTGPDPDACEMEKLGEFAFTCFDKDCTTQMSQPAAAAELCLKTENRTCDGQYYERSILKKTELGCVLILDNNDGDGLLHGPLKRTVHYHWMSDGGNSSYCESSSKKLSESKIRYQLRYYCGTDDCENESNFETAVVSILVLLSTVLLARNFSIASFLCILLTLAHILPQAAAAPVTRVQVISERTGVHIAIFSVALLILIAVALLLMLRRNPVRAARAVRPQGQPPQAAQGAQGGVAAPPQVPPPPVCVVASRTVVNLLAAGDVATLVITNTHAQEERTVIRSGQRNPLRYKIVPRKCTLAPGGSRTITITRKGGPPFSQDITMLIERPPFRSAANRGTSDGTVVFRVIAR